MRQFAAHESAPSNVASVLVDKVAPTIGYTLDPPANSAGWNNSAVTVTFLCADEPGGSGIATCTPPATVATATSGLDVAGAAIDNAGNESSVTAHIKLDPTSPTITYTTSPAPTETGWNRTAVTVTFACTDETGGSGIDSCTPPVTVTDPTQGLDVVGTATDNAGNTTTVTAHVKIDNVGPVITSSVTPTPNTAGWINSTPVTVNFACVDETGGSGIADCSQPVTFTSDGAGQIATGYAVDGAGNTTATSVQVNIDSAGPVLGVPTWSANPKPVATSATLTVPATDALSGVVVGEYYLDSDPGAGNGVPMTYAAGSLTATIGTELAVGVYQVGIRAKDAAGNWGPVTSTMLVLYDPSVPEGIAGKNKNGLVPSLADGDVLPGLTSASQTDSADYGFTVDYTGGVMDSRNEFMFTYTTGNQCESIHPQACHTFTVKATTFDWLIIDQANDSRGRFEGTAAVSVDGSTSTNSFTVEGIDGDRLAPATDDQFTLKIYSPGADTSTASPVYQVSVALQKGNSIKIR